MASLLSPGLRGLRLPFASAPTSRPRICKCFASSRPMHALIVCKATSSQQEQQLGEQLPRLLAGLVVSGSAWSTLVSMAGAATEAVDEDAILEAQQAVLDAVTKEQSAYDLFVSIIFTAVVGLLAVVTLGVAYLSLKQWLDSRQETQDREAEANPKASLFKAVADKAERQKAEEVAAFKSLKKSSRTPLDKSKGFGAKVKELAKNPKEF